MDIPAGRLRRLLYKVFPSLDPHRNLVHYWRLSSEPRAGLRIHSLALYDTGDSGWVDVRIVAKKNGEPLEAVLAAVAKEISLQGPKDKE